MTNAMDTVIGKVLDAVEALNSDTYVIFIGDNGTPWYGGLYGNQIGNMYITKDGRGKGSAWESGCRVPMAIRGPGIEHGVQKSAPVHVADLSGTILTLAGITPPATNYKYNGDEVESDSKSLTPILFGSANDTDRDPNEGYLLTETLTTFPNKTLFVGARNATYKVLCPISSPSLTSCSFYNLLIDPLEEHAITGESKPSSCADYRNGTWTPLLPSPPADPNSPDPRWHYCHLMYVLYDYSVLPPFSLP
jgi:arylsulfatase A-like enzyme